MKIEVSSLMLFVRACAHRAPIFRFVIGNGEVGIFVISYVVPAAVHDVVIVTIGALRVPSLLQSRQFFCRPGRLRLQRCRQLRLRGVVSTAMCNYLWWDVLLGVGVRDALLVDDLCAHDSSAYWSRCAHGT